MMLLPGTKTTIQTGEPVERFLTMVSWDPTGNHSILEFKQRTKSSEIQQI